MNLSEAGYERCSVGSFELLEATPVCQSTDDLDRNKTQHVISSAMKERVTHDRLKKSPETNFSIIIKHTLL